MVWQIDDEMITQRSIKLKRIRLLVFLVCIFGGFGAVLVRLFTVQVLDYKKYVDYSKNQYYQKVTFSPTRGRILDRNGGVLAMTVPMKSVFVSPPMIENKNAASVQIAKDLNMDAETVLSKLERKGHFAWIKRKAGTDEYEALKSRHIKGVMFVDEDRRFYPLKGLGSRALGFCGLDNGGLAGLEYLYDKTLAGEQVTIIAQKDAMGKIYGYGDRPPESNFEIVSTLDTSTQFLAEKAVRTAFDRYKPKAGLAVVMAVHSGEILALAEAPELDPNDYSAYPASRQKPSVVAQSYEPGSIFKIFVSASAIDAGLTYPEDKVNCENGHYTIYDKVFKEAKNEKYKIMPLKDVIAKSSNIGMIKIAQRLGDKRLYEYLRKFGFGAKTGVDLPGEITGLLRDYKAWSAVSLPSISFGQEINATPMQLVTALSVVGNEGVSVRPHLLKRVVKNGKTVMEYTSPASERIISKSAANRVLGMMRYTVTNGTGRLAQTVGYEVAGKTGTAQKFDNASRMYISDRFLSSFVALFPASKPEYAILVMFDEPMGMGWGGEVAAPVAKEIIEGIARLNGMPAQGQKRYDVNWKNVRVAANDIGRDGND
ncbi:MAG: penicillin-binding protein 2 [Nitrospinae bacterium]|nr:penicillin-binding protein 2 [Nitrospinota bacterium]